MTLSERENESRMLRSKGHSPDNPRSPSQAQKRGPFAPIRTKGASTVAWWYSKGILAALRAAATADPDRSGESTTVLTTGAGYLVFPRRVTSRPAACSASAISLAYPSVSGSPPFSENTITDDPACSRNIEARSARCESNRWREANPCEMRAVSEAVASKANRKRPASLRHWRPSGRRQFAPWHQPDTSLTVCPWLHRKARIAATLPRWPLP
jgi:hypothetical protein